MNKREGINISSNYFIPNSSAVNVTFNSSMSTAGSGEWVREWVMWVTVGYVKITHSSGL